MWPSQVDNSGSRVWTLPPSRYQSSIVLTANVCRRSCSRGGGSSAVIVIFAAARTCLKTRPAVSELIGVPLVLMNTVVQERDLVLNQWVR